MLEDVKAAHERAILPQVTVLALTPLVVEDLLDVNRLEDKADVGAALHAHKPERDEPRINVLVADHERHKASGFEQVKRVPRDQTDLVQKDPL